jgi:WD40 repeat protein
VIKRKKQAGQQWLVKCMSISPDSEYICVCSDDDIIRTYHLDTETKKADLVSTYDPELSYPEKNHGICNLTLYLTPHFKD